MRLRLRPPSFKRMLAARTSPKRLARRALGLNTPRGMGWLTASLRGQPALNSRRATNALASLFRPAPPTRVTHRGGGFRYFVEEEAPPLRSPSVEPTEVGRIVTASAAQLVERSYDTVLQQIVERAQRPPLTGTLTVISAAALLLSFWVLDSPAARTASLAIAAACLLALAVWDQARRVSRLEYEESDPEVRRRIHACIDVAQEIAGSAAMWHVQASRGTDDYKRNAGATSLIQRQRTWCEPTSIAGIQTNVEVWGIPVGPQKLLFLPDRLVVQEYGVLASVPYEDLRVSADSVRYVEEEAVPADALQVDETWRFVRKDGGPDRRFNNNALLPVLQYARLTLRSRSGIHLVMQLSAPSAASRAAKRLKKLGAHATDSVAEEA